MTDEDKHTEIGRMVVERQELRRSLACVENKTKRLSDALRRFSEALDGTAIWHIYPDSKQLMVNVGAHAGAKEFDYPTQEEIAQMLEDRKELKAKIAELDARLSDVC